MPASNPITRAVEPLKLDPSSWGTPGAPFRGTKRQSQLPTIIPQQEAVGADRGWSYRQEQRLRVQLEGWRRRGDVHDVNQPLDISPDQP